MLDLKKLEESLDAALAQETKESLQKWFDEVLEKERKHPVDYACYGPFLHYREQSALCSFSLKESGSKEMGFVKFINEIAPFVKGTDKNIFEAKDVVKAESTISENPITEIVSNTVDNYAMAA